MLLAALLDVGLHEILGVRLEDLIDLVEKVVERINGLGQTPAPIGAEEFGRLIREDYARWQRVVKASGAKVD